MPGLPATPNNQVMIPAEASIGIPVEQPRQPQNLQGLLRFAVEAQNAGGSGNPGQLRPLDEERKQFLEEALKSMTVNVTAVMKDQIEILKNVVDISDDEVETKIAAFDTIMEYIDNMDIANDFHKINGFSIFDPCLECKHHRIRAAACDLIAELSQNNPYIQNVVCNATNLMPTILKLLQEDPEEQVQIKAVYAVSCIARDNELGYKNFIHHNGLKACLKALGKDNDKLRTKITFLLSAVQRLDEGLIRKLVSMDFIPILIKIIEGDWKSSHEQVLSLLHSIIENDDYARDELKNQNYRLMEIINGHFNIVRGKEEYKEEQVYCENILKLVFS